MSDAGRWVVGCMTGTSLDALDTALVEVTGEGISLCARLCGGHSEPLDALRSSLRTLAAHEPQPPGAYLHASRALGELHARAIETLCRSHLPASAALDFIAAHGQTICHMPEEGLSWQMLDPWPIVRALNVPVVFDMRQADLVAGGQGAPITPVADWVLFRDAHRSRAVVNLGGICNVTALPAGASPEAIAGGDVGPCNLLLDGLAQRLFDEPCDIDARRARTGRSDDTCVDRIDARIAQAMGAAITLGREQFSARWLDALVGDLAAQVNPADLLASAVEAVARRVALSRWCVDADELVVAGGGARHGLLVERLAHHAHPRAVQSSDALGVPVEAREPVAVAVLGALCRDGVAITLEGVTGASRPGVAGTWAGLGQA